MARHVHPRVVCEPPEQDDVRELLAAHGVDETGALRQAAHGVVYYGPGTEWTPPPLRAGERLKETAKAPRRPRPWPSQQPGYRSPFIDRGVAMEPRAPCGDLAYWTPERLANLRDRLRAVGLPEIRPGVFRWTPDTGGSCEPIRS